MFSHLHVHSHYSLLDGLIKIPDLVQKASDEKMPAIALTDHGAMYGAIEFYKACRAAGIKPILGFEAYLSPFPVDSPAAKTQRSNFHLTVLAKDLTGYKNLMKLCSLGWLAGFYYRPRIDKLMLKKYHQGLILLSGCASGEIPQALIKNQPDRARELVAEYRSLVGDENFYLEIQDHPEIADYQKLRQALPELAQKMNVPLVATNDAHYLNIADKTAQDALVCIQLNKKMNDANRLTLTASNYHFASVQEMTVKFADLPEALSNTHRIADQCDLEIELNKWVFPSVEIPAGETAKSHLQNLVNQGLQEKLVARADAATEADTNQAQYQTRLDYELDIINRKGYAPYFLVVADIVNFAKNHTIITTTRGSAAGSLVSYAIGITTADPMDYNLPFERFLNPYRPSPPDIDLDIEDARRGELINYVREKYGEDRVAQIITFGTLLARAAVRDVGRVLGHPYSLCDKISKLIPIGSQGFKMSLHRALEENPNLKQAYEENEDVKQIIDLAKQIEGCVRHASLHAAGLVIAPTALTDFTPLQRDSKQGEITTQYDMHAIEDAGLLKMDLLGITNLSILGLARKIIARTAGLELDLQHLPPNDAKTYQLLAEGKTMGVFQLAGSGITRYLKELAPSNIFDIMAIISLYRPGPIDSIPEYIRRKHNPELITYPHPKLENILKLSYGVITYQDDVLVTAIELAGYDWSEADKLRKAIGKKIPREMAAQKNKFLTGCVEHSGLERFEAEKIWKLIEPFAAYGFNKAHGSSYALVAYQTAYVKANYPVEFMAALLTCEAGNLEKVAEGMSECANLGIKVLPPDVNECFGGFTVSKKKRNHQHSIRFGLRAIKNLGNNIIEQIINERKLNGPYQNLTDFLTRVTSNNKKSLEALVRSGAMDSFGPRALLDHNIENMLALGKVLRDNSNSSQESLFSLTQARQVALKNPPPDSVYPILPYEKEYLGLYISAHPLDKFKPHLERLAINQIVDFKNSQINSGLDKKAVKLLGIVTATKSIKTKSNEQMMFVTLEDLSGTLELLVFPRLLKSSASAWQVDQQIILEGSITTKDDEIKVIASKVWPITDDDAKKIATGQASEGKSYLTKTPGNKKPALPETPSFGEYYIALPAKLSKVKLNSLKSILKAHSGPTPVYLRVEADRVKILKTTLSVTMSPDLERAVAEIIGNS
ncbi:MAG: DNA polymerase III subunit alpha [Candidatus Jacksonbacteria bacterium RIFOXYC2_FULL_44_29]|nr:MAG: polymerase III, alpha subunit protein [Parcubacteria group bacterium GW2011_GWC2_44_22]OGY75592.1 MAG: DNA polymerase III subunit alpha [Candidatus Jacksonbacteria bacterium RIFOXYB2_FULL_44_15]OGY75686.1 MAG: DNA polymerase III subunit alpha [Candidatus Jacksonbacteria bacterium RIFOXYA2_FULL_43_12]OGY77580.1 MAG: DNA polymerase III subunit alpha [Candidatus Jacksonbacteria bacterium RIFOXYC2_FULL_44_29]OGY81748.1 MAG: DNA polymerase III subunit alpha [Candidatus Jacksonbacteria bacter